MDLTLTETAIVIIGGSALILLTEWAIFRNKDTKYRKRYHPIMTLTGAVCFGILAIFGLYSEGSSVWWPVPLAILISVLFVAFWDIKNRKICLSCGYEANAFGIDGNNANHEFCPKCGSSYE